MARMQRSNGNGCYAIANDYLVFSKLQNKIPNVKNVFLIVLLFSYKSFSQDRRATVDKEKVAVDSNKKGEMYPWEDTSYRKRPASVNRNNNDFQIYHRPISDELGIPGGLLEEPAVKPDTLNRPK